MEINITSFLTSIQNELLILFLLNSGYTLNKGEKSEI